LANGIDKSRFLLFIPWRWGTRQQRGLEASKQVCSSLFVLLLQYFLHVHSLVRCFILHHTHTFVVCRYRDWSLSSSRPLTALRWHHSRKGSLPPHAGSARNVVMAFASVVWSSGATSALLSVLPLSGTLVMRSLLSHSRLSACLFVSS